MKLFVGLDVSLAKTALCVISEHGKILKEAQIASEPEELLCCIRQLDGSVATVGLEAGPLAQWLHRSLTEAGLEAVLMETRQVKGALKACRSRPIGAMPKGLPVFFIWAGSDLCIASPCRHRRFELF